MSTSTASAPTTLAAVDPGLIQSLRAAADEVGTRATDRLAAAHDASHYLLTPQAVVKPASVSEVSAVFAAAAAESRALTFRSGGTSLSGQAVTDAVLLDTRQHFRDIEVLDGGERVRCGPGATLRAVNARLTRHGRRLGPDPASEIACTIGGVVANNSSGMACGIETNTYRTLDSSVLVLPSGTVLDTAAPGADARLREAEPAIHAGLNRLRDSIRDDEDAVDRLQALYSIKNTMGYGLNSFLDHDEPVRILERLIIGSEGTLAFVAEATFRTVPVKSHAATGLLLFEDLRSATAALPELVETGFATIELMDATSLRVAQQDPESPEEVQALDVEHHAALLVELQETTSAELEEQLQEVRPVLEALPLSLAPELTTDSSRRAAFWHTRKGLFTAVAGNRPRGTTALLEDIAVPVEKLGKTCEELNRLFTEHGYDSSVIFGHAKDGNVHFMINESFDADLGRYEDFTEEMVDLVLSQGGTLKAEHGTGRIMAPFVLRQVGDHLYSIMEQVKGLIDPSGILNPGVLLTDDPQAHLRNLKTAPVVEEEVDRCVECGYCEPVCPSRTITTTPRERIVLRRELARAEEAGDTGLAETLRQEYKYDGLETCAVDGMCATACPVFINTGDLVRRLREENGSRVEKRVWKTAAQHWGGLSRAGGAALTAARMLPASVPRAASDIARRLLGEDTVPRYTSDLPRGGRRRPQIEAAGAEIVWFPSCTSTMFGQEQAVRDASGDSPDSGEGVDQAFRRLCDRAGVTLRTPPDIPSLCCGTPWKSKGHSEGYDEMQRRVIRALRAATEGGRLQVVCDASSCTEGLEVMVEEADGAGIQVLDAVEYAAERILPELPAGPPLRSVTLHPTCSSVRMELGTAFEALAAAVAEKVHVPQSWGCCAFAGDRGMLHPELTASATAAEAEEVVRQDAAAHASLNRTCEMGMSRATGKQYRHILEILDEVTS